MSKLQYVILTWDDSYTLDQGESWTDLSDVDLNKPFWIASAGILIKETKKHITIATAVHGDTAIKPLRIPMACIEKIKRFTFPFPHTDD